MLVSFRVDNWKCFSNEVSLSMVASRERQHAKRVPFVSKYKIKLLPISAVFGANGTGKSALFSALDFARQMVVESHGLNTLHLLRPNRTNQESTGRPTKFTFEILAGGTIYEYYFSLSLFYVVEERLTIIRSASETVLFERENLEIAFHPSLPTQEHLRFAFNGTRNNQLFLTNSVFQNLEHFKAVFDWFSDSLVLIGPNTKFFSSDLLSDTPGSLLSHLNDILPLFDTGIVRVEIESVPLERVYMTNEMIESIYEELKHVSTTYINDIEDLLIFSLGRQGELQAHEVKTIHHGDDGTEIRFGLSDESDGTRRLFDLLPAISDLTMAGSNRVYVVDEIDRSIHTLLTRQLLTLYLQSCTQNSSTQLIFTTHDVQLMDQRLMRRDEMWATERNGLKGSSLISFAEYRNIRKDKKIRNSYLEGRLGGVPNLIEVHQPTDPRQRDVAA